MRNDPAKVQQDSSFSEEKEAKRLLFCGGSRSPLTSHPGLMRRAASAGKKSFYCDRLKIRQIASGGQGFALDPPGAALRAPWTVLTIRETPRVAKQ
jgi:hypothetical protein